MEIYEFKALEITSKNAIEVAMNLPVFDEYDVADRYDYIPDEVQMSNDNTHIAFLLTNRKGNSKLEIYSIVAELSEIIDLLTTLQKNLV
jgi:hypothetical protein